MGKFLSGILFIITMIVACSSPNEKKVVNSPQQKQANVETKTNTSSSAAKANNETDSAVIIRPVHKYKHQKKFKLK